MRVALVSATRGDGGQNEIGPELFDALGILRTEELLAAHQYDGAEQYFARAVDFGYSFSPEETLEKWGRTEILGDFVRHIRTLRPDVIVTLGVDGTGGGQHHQTSAVIAAEAYKAAADPTQFPEQIKAGLRPWQAKKLYRTAGGIGGRGRGGPGGPGGPGGRGGGGRGPAHPGRVHRLLPQQAAPAAPGAAPADPNAHFATIDTNVYEPLLGCTIAEVGGVASGMHMCQGRAPLVPAPGLSGARYRLVETVLASQRDKDETSLFEGVDTSLMGLSRFAGAKQSDALVRGLAIASAHVAAATQALNSEGPAAAVQPLVYGLSAIRELRSNLAGAVADEGGRYEIDFRLAQKEEQFQDALVLAQSLRIEAIANDGLIVPGQPLSVTVDDRQPRRRRAADAQHHARRARRAVRVRGADRRTARAVQLCGDGQRSRECAADRSLLGASRGCRPRHVRTRRALRPAVPADAFQGAARDGHRRHRGESRSARAVPLRGRRAHRREADGAQRRAGLRGQRVAADRGRAAAPPRRGRECRPRAAGDRRQRRKRRGVGAGAAEDAGRVDGSAGLRAGVVHARRRGGDDPLHVDAAGEDRGRAGADQRRGDRRGRAAHRPSTTRATR